MCGHSRCHRVLPFKFSRRTHRKKKKKPTKTQKQLSLFHSNWLLLHSLTRRCVTRGCGHHLPPTVSWMKGFGWREGRKKKKKKKPVLSCSSQTDYSLIEFPAPTGDTEHPSMIRTILLGWKDLGPALVCTITRCVRCQAFVCARILENKRDLTSASAWNQLCFYKFDRALSSLESFVPAVQLWGVDGCIYVANDLKLVLWNEIKAEVPIF